MKNKKSITTRILSLMLIAFLTFSAVSVSVFAVEVENEEAAPYSNASFSKEEGLLNALDFVDITDSNTVTREEFVISTAKLLGLKGEGFGGAVPYADVDYTSEVYGYAGMLCSLGVLSASEYFYPEVQITENEATKILVSALGYDYEAKLRGGWPTGYLALGSSLGLTKCFDGNAIVERSEFIMLCYEFINSNVRTFKTYGTDSFELENGKTVLEEYHNIVTVEGYVEANDHSGLRSAQGAVHKGYVKIGGYTYKEPKTMQSGMNLLGDYLGYYVRIYVSGDKNDKNIYGYETIDSTVVTLDSANITSFKDFSVTENGDTKVKTYKLSKDYQIIYNGVAANDCTENDLLFADGKIELIKTADSSDYNLVYVWKTEYVVVDTFVSDGSVVTDKSGKKYGRLQTQSIKLDDEDVIYDFSVEENGIERLSNITELSKYPTLAIWISKNGEYIKVKGFENSISGIIEGTSANGIVVSGTEYELADYAKSASWTASPEKLDIILSDEGKILYTEIEGNLMKYGYLMKVKSEGGLGGYVAYVLRANGDKATFPLAEKINIDGATYDVANAINNGFLAEYQIIKYSESSDGKIKRIDTAQTDMLYEKNMDPYNNLRNYGNRVAQWYGRSYNFFYPDLRISSAIVFNVPTQLKTDKANYTFNEGDFFVEGLPSEETRIDADIFDITEDRDCGALVRYNDANPDTAAPELVEGSSKAVVDSVVNAINEDGEAVRKVTLVQNTYYKEYYFSSLLEQLFTQEGKTINPGDIVRFSYIGNTLTNLRVEFNVREWGMDSKLDSSLASSYSYDNGTDGSNAHYAYGKVHHITGNSVVIQRDNGNLYLVSDSSATVMYYSRLSNTVKPMNRNDLLTISNSSDEVAHKAVVFTRYFKEVHILVFYGD